MNNLEALREDILKAATMAEESAKCYRRALARLDEPPPKKRRSAITTEAKNELRINLRKKIKTD